MLETANVMFTDTVGSTSTLTRIGADAAEAERHRHDSIVANVVTVFGGRVVKSTGDGTLALLPSADHLVRAGIGRAGGRGGRGDPVTGRLVDGDVVSEHGDCFGEAVVVASRLCAQCPPGSVLVDATTVVVRGRRRDPPIERLAAAVTEGIRRAAGDLDVSPPAAVADARAADALEQVYGREEEAAQDRERVDVGRGAVARRARRRARDRQDPPRDGNGGPRR